MTGRAQYNSFNYLGIISHFKRRQMCTNVWRITNSLVIFNYPYLCNYFTPKMVQKLTLDCDSGTPESTAEPTGDVVGIIQRKVGESRSPLENPSEAFVQPSVLMTPVEHILLQRYAVRWEPGSGIRVALPCRVHMHQGLDTSHPV